MSVVRMDDASTAGRTDDVVPVRMGRADRMLAVLKDGREHSREEILRRSPGGFFLTNNAASDLRKRGYDVRFRVKDGLRLYRLAGSLDAVSAPAVGNSSPSVCVGDAQEADTASNEPGHAGRDPGSLGRPTTEPCRRANGWASGEGNEPVAGAAPSVDDQLVLEVAA